jgi:short-subunit dehydrogenase
MDKKVIVITGISSGMGKATALLLAQNGYAVYGGARRVEKLQKLEKQEIKTAKLDVTDDKSVTEFINFVMEKEGKIDVLVNNAGYGEYGAVEDVTLENAKKQIEVNLFGVARMTKAVLPTMRAQKSGKIINITSIGGKMATPMGGWYHASKFAVEGLSDSLRNEVRQFGIDVVVIEPGGIQTEWSDIAMKNLSDTSEKSAYANLAKRAAKFSSGLDETQSKIPEPIVIAQLIKIIIEKRNPKARYAKGFMAKPILFFKWLLSDSLFDKVIMSQFK